MNNKELDRMFLSIIIFLVQQFNPADKDDGFIGGSGFTGAKQ
jgi:hypothetical protein